MSISHHHCVLLVFLVLTLSSSSSWCPFVVVVDGFLIQQQQQQTKGIDSLQEIAKSQVGTTFHTILDVGELQQHHIFLNNFQFELLSSSSSSSSTSHHHDDDNTMKNNLNKKMKKATSSSSTAIRMPGAHGPSPQVSSGVFPIRIISRPSFVSMDGIQHLSLDDECSVWEIVWRDSSPTGTLVCGFNVLQGVKRNEAFLSSGRLYISIPIWSKDGLAEQQSKKIEAFERSMKHLQKRDEELEKMKFSNNPIQKAMHYHAALEAVELYTLSNGSFTLQKNNIPDSDQDVIHLGNGLLASTTGTVWRKTEFPFHKKLRVGNIKIRSQQQQQQETDNDNDNELLLFKNKTP